MKGRGNFGVLFPQFNGLFRITFQAQSVLVLGQIKQGKHLPHYFKDQGGVIKRETFSDSGFGDAIFADFFEVHLGRNKEI